MQSCCDVESPCVTTHDRPRNMSAFPTKNANGTRDLEENTSAFPFPKSMEAAVVIFDGILRVPCISDVCKFKDEHNKLSHLDIQAGLTYRYIPMQIYDTGVNSSLKRTLTEDRRTDTPAEIHAKSIYPIAVNKDADVSPRLRPSGSLKLLKS